jgi:hypothetical protein
LSGMVVSFLSCSGIVSSHVTPWMDSVVNINKTVQNYCPTAFIVLMLRCLRDGLQLHALDQ